MVSLNKNNFKEIEKELDDARMKNSRGIEKQLKIFKIDNALDNDIKQQLVTVYSDIAHLEGVALKSNE